MSRSGDGENAPSAAHGPGPLTRAGADVLQAPRVHELVNARGDRVGLLDYGARASTDGFFEVLTELRAPNLFGRAQHAGLRALVGSERTIFRLSYHSPYLSRYRLDTDFFVERSTEHLGEAPADFTDRAWTFTAGMTAPQCAGVIHSDFERGFIAGEIVAFDDLVAAGSFAKCKQNATLRIVGKDYLVADGDVADWRFNV